MFTRPPTRLGSRAVTALLPPLTLAIAWLLAIFGVTPPGADGSAPFDESALRWVLFLSGGWGFVGGAVMHTVFARPIARSIGWETSGFQYEMGFASLGIGLGAIYAAIKDSPEAWVAASVAAGVFLLLAGFNHVRESFAERNFAPGNTVVLLSDFGVPISLFVLLLATNAI